MRAFHTAVAMYVISNLVSRNDILNSNDKVSLELTKTTGSQKT